VRSTFRRSQVAEWVGQPLDGSAGRMSPIGWLLDRPPNPRGKGRHVRTGSLSRNAAKFRWAQKLGLYPQAPAFRPQVPGRLKMCVCLRPLGRLDEHILGRHHAVLHQGGLDHVALMG
jgi:hypothetical protein